MARWMWLAQGKKSQGKTQFGVQFHVCGKYCRSLIQTCLYNSTLHQSQGGAALDSTSVGGSGLFSLYKLLFLKREKLNAMWDSQIQQLPLPELGQSAWWCWSQEVSARPGGKIVHTAAKAFCKCIHARKRDFSEAYAVECTASYYSWNGNRAMTCLCHDRKFSFC